MVNMSQTNLALLATPRELGFSERAINCCENLKIRWIGDLVRKTDAELLRVPNMGRKSLSDIKATLAKYGLSLGTDDASWGELDPETARASIPGGIRFALSQLEVGDDSSDVRNLQVEVRATIAKVANPRNLSIVLSLWGLDGTQRKILEDVGQTFDMTRERVRQIEAKVIRDLQARWHKLPSLDEAVACVEKHSPMVASHLTETLRDCGLETDFISAAAFMTACGVFERKLELLQANDFSPSLIGRDEDIETIRKAVRVLRRETSSLGCTSLSRIQFTLSGDIAPSQALFAGLESLDEVVWLDAKKHWLLSKNPTRNRIFNILEKIFSASRSVHLSELRQAISRPHRMRFAPPAEILGSLCEYFGFQRDANNTVSTTELLNAEFGELDSTFVKAFKVNGSPITREELEEYCVGVEGMNIASFYQYLSYCPLVQKLAFGVYGLVGAPAPPGAVEAVKRRVGQDRVPPEFGWTQSGLLWFVFQLTRLSVHSGAFFVPTFINEHVGGIWTAKLSSGPRVGEVEIGQGMAAGFKAAFQLLGADARDYCLLQFDLSKKILSIEVGGSDLEDRAGQDSREGPSELNGPEDIET